MCIEIRRPDLYSVVKQGVIDGLQKVQEIQAAGKYIGRYHDFPKQGSGLGSGLVIWTIGFGSRLVAREKRNARAMGALNQRRPIKSRQFVQMTRCDPNSSRYRTLTDNPGSHQICHVCFWEDDPVQLLDPWYDRGANKVLLQEAQNNFVQMVGHSIISGSDVHSLFRAINGSVAAARRVGR